jgi:signal peptidase I
MVHDTIPVLNKRSYSKFPQLPYMRIPGFQSVNNNDIVVFNWPADTVKQFFKQDLAQYKPIDKKSHYVKRCVAIAGDSLEIKQGIVYINGKEVSYPDRADLQNLYKIKTYDSLPFLVSTMRKFQEQGILASFNKNYSEIILNLTDDKKKLIKTYSNIEEFSLFNHGKGRMYGNKNWDTNNFGPIYIPKKGDVLQLNKETYPFYKWIIQRYDSHDAEHKLNKHEVALKGNDVYIDGELTKEYTVQQDYYWMMGDNRGQSEDSRFWGYVPYDHVVGKPVFIFFSKGQNGIRWNRVFTTVAGEGERVSYLIPFVVLVLLYFGYAEYKKKKK